MGETNQQEGATTVHVLCGYSGPSEDRFVQGRTSALRLAGGPLALWLGWMPGHRVSIHVHSSWSIDSFIKALSVKCSSMERGCEWVGTVGALEKHVATCGFTLVPCPKLCKNDSDEVNHFIRKDLDKHLKND